MPQAMKDKMRAITNEISLQIQEINGNPAFSPKQKVEKIGSLKGAPKKDLYDFLNLNFRTGPGLSEEIKKVISKDRPIGGIVEALKRKKDK